MRTEGEETVYVKADRHTDGRMDGQTDWQTAAHTVDTATPLTSGYSAAKNAHIHYVNN